jgi:hypothetical protein
MAQSLVILAAGLGSRYGGLKQLEPVGPGGEAIVHYALYDAIRAGFDHAVFVIRPEMESVVHEVIGRRYERQVSVSYAFQRLDDLPRGHVPPAGRSRPWGTGHAVLAARHAVRGSFAVVNADDLYGPDSFAEIGAFLRTPDRHGVATHAMVGFRLRDTLTPAGTVNRGCCRCDIGGWLETIEETIGIAPHGADAGVRDDDGRVRVIDGGTLVSMNMWGFRPALLELLETEFGAFLEKNAGRDDAEFHLPAGVQALIASGQARVRVLPTRDRWSGVTYPADRPRVVERIGELIERRVYPRRLWS